MPLFDFLLRASDAPDRPTTGGRSAQRPRISGFFSRLLSSSLARYSGAIVVLMMASQLSRGEAMLELFQVNWNDLINKMPEIAEAGYTSLWLPPPAKGSSVFSVGYDLFDPFDLGDKNQRGTTATKYGTKDQLIKVVETAHRFGIRVYFDNIMNHRAFDVPGYNSSTPTNLYPALIPKDFHLQTISGGFYRNWPNVENYGNQWDVQYESLSGLIDLANESGTINSNYGNTLGSTATKPFFIRQPANPDYYVDTSKPFIGGNLWRPFNGSNGVPVAEYVQDYEIRAAMWTMYVTKCDGFRLDAVKHVPSGFFGNGGNVWAGYTGAIQATYDWVHGFGTNFNSNYVETDDCRNSCFDSEAARNDALLFGEHLGEPPTYGEYVTAGMRLLNTPMRSAVDSWGGGGSGSGLDQLNVGSSEIQANQGVQFAQDQDHSLCCVNNRSLENAYFFMHEGIPMIYSDGNNWAGSPSDGNTFPIVPLANYLGQYNDNQMPEICYLHHQLARGGTRSRWSDANIVAWERYDYRDITDGSDPNTNANATVVFFAANNKTSFPGDVSFDDGISRASDGYYMCTPASNSRGYAMKVGFPPGSVLVQLASSSPGANRACPKLLVHNATTSSSTAQSMANDPNPVNRALLVNSTPPTGGGAIELLIPSGGWVMYGYQWPEPSRANVYTNAITFLQGGVKAPTITVFRKDGANGDTNFFPIYPFKMRGSVDPNGNVITTGGLHVSNLTYSIDIPIVTNAPFDVVVRSDASTVNVQSKLDGGMDLNSQMGIGNTSGLERRDNRPGSSNGTDVFVGYETNAYQFRDGPEKFAAKDISRNNVTSFGAETYYYTTGGLLASVNGSGNGANITTSTPSWVFHDPASPPTSLSANPATQMNPTNPAAGQAVDIWVKVANNAQTDRCYIYYTTDGSNPEGAFGAGKATTRVAAASWVNHDSSDNTVDWFKGTIPGSNQVNGVQVRYKVALYQENIGTISDSDTSKVYGLTQFGITNFNPTTVTVWTHNDRNTNNTQTGLSSGFHIMRARAFLPRSGKSSVYNTFLQTFYYDGQLPGGLIATPAADGASISNGTYTIVIRADSTTTGVEVNVQDSNSANDDAVTGQNNGNGLTNGVPAFAAATNATPDPNLSAIYTNYPQEFHFTYKSVPSNGVATITVHLKGFATSVFPNRYGTVTRTINTIAPSQVLQISDPATDGMILVLDTNQIYDLKACFTSTLDTNQTAYFNVYINGVFQPRSGPSGPLYHISPNGCGTGFRVFFYDWLPTPGSNTLTVTFTNGLFLSDTRTFAVVQPGDSDGDGMSDYNELIAGTDPYNSNSVLRITSLDTTSQLLVWDSVSNVNYQVLSTTNLSQPFVPLSPVISSGGASTFYVDTAPDPTNKFYRIQVVP